MRFDTSQQMRLGQQMKLAPRMIQSMEILQLPTLALEERIEQELESNVTLETAGPEVETEEGRREEGESDQQERELDIDLDHPEHDFERLDSMETSYGEAFENEYSAASLHREHRYEPGEHSRARLDGERDSKMEAMANTAARGASLHDQLIEQWTLADVEDRRLFEAGLLLIGFVEEDGLIRTPLETIADRAPNELSDLDERTLEQALRTFQHIVDPPGIGGRDLRECLLLQVEALSAEVPERALRLPRELIADHLDELLQNRLPQMAERTGASLEQIKDAVKWMQRLSPAPGRRLVESTPPAIVPDAIVEYDEEEGRYIAYLNDQRLPNLRINEAYAKMVRDRSVEKPTREFVRKNLSNAQWLLDAIAQRNHTLQRVLNVVVEEQSDFFDQGAQALRPLAMTQVADQLGVHVATVSRAVSGKHVQTPRGVMPLRRFFSGGAQTESGEDISWDAVKAALQEIVARENKASPLSDEALSESLRERGIDIARRTVAKYRSQLNIPSARMRRQY